VMPPGSDDRLRAPWPPGGYRHSAIRHLFVASDAVVGR
jgi:hypothetical protein